ncbi:DUF6524 family protein [Motiliproteus sp. SC1-56]|uniref:DUF6524 family protein n=1 Tax=Motiliproteus sp. SC1-56 TaxID=2799565 RepID=UPI001A8EE1B9|nr:DUF6524 family protein [Motiliproteus sp. SC1-56]
MAAKSEKFDFLSFLGRLLFSSALVFLTYNPSGHSFIHRLVEVFPSVTPFLAISGILLVIGWVVYVKATMEALGTLGLVLASALFVAVIWLLVDIGWLTLASSSVIAWLILILIALLLAIGMSWSHIHRRLSGQVHVDDIDE